MATKNFEIQLSNLAIDGSACVNPTITWEEPLCGAIKCELNGGTVLKVELPEDCQDCFYVVITCQNNCTDCPPERLKICPCRIDADCPDCEICGPSGYCVSTCPPDWVCDGEQCKECTDEVPCPCNQVCVMGKCECPADKPYKDSKGCCTECASDTQCPPCFVCTPDGCVPKECPTGHCDPDTNQCVECYNSGHCPPNQCCVNGHCECCPGFYADPDTGVCVPNPSCERDSDCPPCHVCNEGTCIPIACPSGYVRTNGDPCCKPECDCLTPNCTHGANCLPDLLSGKCYCEGCGGSCDENIDCPPGCYCDGTTCVPNPCYGPCAYGSDCGPGCGCLNGVCVPCNSAECNNCPDIDGCVCTNGADCKKGCSGPCFGAEDCAPGCGCDEGKCKPCSDFDCTECPNIPGCKCTNGLCVDDPCSDTNCKCLPCNGIEDCGIGCYCKNGTCVQNPCAGPCSGSDNCAPGCHCVGGSCVPCEGPCGDDGNPYGDPPCEDSLFIMKLDPGCDLEGKLSTKKCCQCDNISAGFDFTVTSAGANNNADLTISLAKGAAANWADFLPLPKLNATGVINELPITGAVEVITQAYLTPADSNCNPIVGGVDILVKSAPKLYNFAGTWTQTNTFSYFNYTAGNCTTVNGIKYYVVRTEFVVTPKTEFVFPNDCKYKMASKIIATEAPKKPITNTNADTAVTLKLEAACRRPLFTWFKSASKTNLFNTANIFRKKYANKTGTLFTDKLYDYNTDGLEYGKYYGIQTDCGCVGDSVYDCDGDKGADRLTFNHPLDFTVSLDSCGNVVTFDEVLINCDVMMQSPMRPRYELLLNGKSVAILVLPFSGILIADGTTFSLTPAELIKTVTLRLLDTDCPYQLTKTVDSAGLEINVSIEAKPCGADPIEFTINTSGGTGPYTYTVSVDGGAPINGNFSTSPYSFSLPRVDGTYVITVTDSNGCTASKTVVYNDTSNKIEDKITITSKCVGSGGFIVVTNNHNEAVNVIIDGNPAVILSAGATGQYAVASGNHTVNVTLVSDPLCGFSNVEIVNIDCCEDADITVSQVCDPLGTKTITVTNNGTQNINVQVFKGVTLVGSCASVAPAGTCVKSNLVAGDLYTVKASGLGVGCTELSVPVNPVTCSTCNDWKNGIILSITCSSNIVNWTITNSNIFGTANVTGTFAGVLAPGASQVGSTANSVTFNFVRADDPTCFTSKGGTCVAGCEALDVISIVSDCTNPLSPVFTVNNPGLTPIKIYKDGVLYSNTSNAITSGAFTAGSTVIIKVELQSNPSCNKSVSLACAVPPSPYTVTYDCLNGIVVSGGYTGQIKIDNGPTNYSYPTSPIYLQDGNHSVKLILDNSTTNLTVNCCTHNVVMTTECDNTQAPNLKGAVTANITGALAGKQYLIQLYTTANVLVQATTELAAAAAFTYIFVGVPDGSYYLKVTDVFYGGLSYVGNNTLPQCVKQTNSQVIDCDIITPCMLNVALNDFSRLVCGTPGNAFCYTYQNNTGFTVDFVSYRLPQGSGSCFDENNPNWVIDQLDVIPPGGSYAVSVLAPASCGKFEIIKDAACMKTGWLTDDGTNLIVHFY